MSVKHFLKNTCKKNVWSSFAVLAAILFLTTGITACSKISIQNQRVLPGTLDTGIFSNRPQMQDKSIILIQFQNPPLLSSVQIVDGKKVVDQDLKKSILSEQALAEESLKKLSSDILILYRYKMVLNAFAVIAPNALLDQLKGIGGVSYVEAEGSFDRPRLLDVSATSSTADFSSANSVKFIGAEIVHQMKVKDKNGNEVPLDGTGMKVGIIDTGVDYTHAMFGGAGTEAAYKSVAPSSPNLNFPTAKVVGGIDLAGTSYNSGSANLKNRLPLPDTNPLDEAGHGSHVAGTVAGKGDGVNTYDGVAPGAQLYAIKVFGATGSTGDAVVIAGLEYAADPTGSDDPSQQLDAVNLSLGGPYGSPHTMYQIAISNLTKAGTLVLCAAGNESAVDYIVGAPSISDDAFSIAASVDNASQNWQFPAVKFSSTTGDIVALGIAAPTAKPLAEVGDLSGALVYVGLADKDFDSDTKAKLKGKVAFIDRGVVSFSNKISRAQEAGALGVVVANNQTGDPFQMGGEGSFNIPAVMIAQSIGDVLKEKMKTSDVIIQFNSPEKISKKELIDTIASFSSKGPRSLDSLIKPEISAPGQSVISAQMGKGNLGVQLSGTSMATPHMAGVMTLLKQLHPDLSVSELKSLAMSTAKSISDANGKEYPVSIQGAGRVQVDKAVLAQAVTLPSALSLGEQNISSKKTVQTQVTVKNISGKLMTFTPSFRARTKAIKMLSANPLILAGGDSGVISLRFVLDGTLSTDPSVELDGFVTLKTGDAVDLTLPVLAVIKKISNIKSEQLNIYSSADDSAGAAVDLTLKNSGANTGDVMIFNLLGFDTRKSNPTRSKTVDTSCNLQAAGYRIIKKRVESGEEKFFLQVVAKLYQPEDTWNMCEVSVLIDKDGKGVPTQELAGIALGNVPGLSDPKTANQFSSVLFDAAKVRDLRKDFELISQVPVKAGEEAPKENYQPSVLAMHDMLAINHSTVAIVEAALDDLSATASGDLSIRVATISDNDSVQSDDFLEKSPSQWTKISLQESSQSFVGMPEKITLNPGEVKELSLTKGFGSQGLLVLYPQNANVYSDLITDGQAELVTPVFGN